jgi:hypothetical protein
MGELEKRIDSKLQKYTGGDVGAWRRRAEEFVRNPERRKYMRQKLVNLLGDWVNFRKGKETGKNNEFKVEEDESGLKSYYANSVSSFIGVSIFPPGTRVSELRVDDARFTYGASGYRANWEIIKEDGANYHFLSTPSASTYKTYNPINGFTRDGEVITGFKNKNPGSLSNEQESGGIFVVDGGLEILPYSELIKPKKAGMSEQATFIADSDNWSTICALPSYRLPVVFSPVFVGNFYNNGNKRQFSAVYYGKWAGMSEFFGVLNNVATREQFDSWETACLDFGGVYAAMLREEGDGSVKALGSTTYGFSNPETFDHGHTHKRFLDFSWPKD